VSVPDREVAVIVADLLDRGEKLDALSRLLSAVTLGGLIATVFGPARPALVGGFAFSLLCGLFEAFLALRIGFDAALFRRISDGGLDLAALDGAMLRLGLLPPEKSGRAIEARFAGARRLLVRQGIALVGQIFSATAVIVLHTIPA
jgi:hypothetical protein